MDTKDVLMISAGRVLNRLAMRWPGQTPHRIPDTPWRLRLPGDGLHRQKKAAQFKKAYINAFNAMEQQLTTPPALLEPPIPPQRFLSVIDQGQIHQYPLNSDQALIDLPKLAVKVKQMEALHQALGQQIEDLKKSYDLGFYLGR